MANYDTYNKAEIDEKLADIKEKLENKVDKAIVMSTSLQKPDAEETLMWAKVLGTRDIIVAEGITISDFVEKLGVGAIVSRTQPDHACLWAEPLATELLDS